MNKIIIAPIIVGVVIAIISSVLLIPNPDDTSSETLSVSYTDTNKELQLILDAEQIAMSSPLRLNGLSIDEYCVFFADETIQNAISYCTSTELLDSEGQYLGNIHMVGTPGNPVYVIGVIQADPFVSQLDDIKIVYQTMIESVVEESWEEKKPGDFDSVSSWIEAANAHHLEAKRTTSKSAINGLAPLTILLEVTTNEDGYMWKLIIPN